MVIKSIDDQYKNTIQCEPLYCKVAVDMNYCSVLDYLLPLECKKSLDECLIGHRVLVNVGSKKMVGIIIGMSNHSTVRAEKLKPIVRILDPKPMFSLTMFEFYSWIAHYYQQDLSKILFQALPNLFKTVDYDANFNYYRLRHDLDHSTKQSKKASQLSKVQKSVLERFQQSASEWIELFTLKEMGVTVLTLKVLQDKGWLEHRSCNEMDYSSVIGSIALNEMDICHIDHMKTLTQQQDWIVQQVLAKKGFKASLIYGVTGSGKTEIYLALCKHILLQRKKVLILIPEVSLMVSMQQRYSAVLRVPVITYHHRCDLQTKAKIWQRAQSKELMVVIATRSGILLPFVDLGLIVIDEEHDRAYKQQEIPIYHGRDVSIWRAKQLNCPVVLGSATPALESLYNGLQGKYQLFKLTERPFGTLMPQIKVTSILNKTLYCGISKAVLTQIEQTLKQNKQVLVFINRRGFSPFLICQHCGHIAHCPACDLALVLHKTPPSLQCHGCGFKTAIPIRCEVCAKDQLQAEGFGTQRIEQALTERFSHYAVIRIDRDSTRTKHAFNKKLEKVHAHEPVILLGTQMLAKGHDFSRLHLVVVLNADQGIYSSDFRSLEYTAQLIIQVAGRAGRTPENLGLVILQTRLPNHPFYNYLCNNDYLKLANWLLKDRLTRQLPPYGYLVLIGCNVKKNLDGKFLLDQLVRYIEQFLTTQHCQSVHWFGPMPAAIPRRKHLFYWHLLLQSGDRAVLHQLTFKLNNWINTEQEAKKKASWVIDIDPIEMVW